jgi:hypothetical protein
LGSVLSCTRGTEDQRPQGKPRKNREGWRFFRFETFDRTQATNSWDFPSPTR